MVTKTSSIATIFSFLAVLDILVSISLNKTPKRPVDYKPQGVLALNRSVKQDWSLPDHNSFPFLNHHLIVKPCVEMLFQHRKSMMVERQGQIAYALVSGGYCALCHT
ncbi:hypothetical protein [Desulfobacter postgatei]|jgi:hypothetical protein|uniref:hypothetical protein n=1 Tax=Desulfobacter postgatei TaxID=2293 RepID=UPI002A35C52D|nr:hypothetical protein [Desulfobacter postgatei]MDX9963485.1 hypothetical protein [Desulfobacter postgatei]